MYLYKHYKQVPMAKTFCTAVQCSNDFKPKRNSHTCMYIQRKKEKKNADIEREGVKEMKNE